MLLLLTRGNKVPYLHMYIIYIYIHIFAKIANIFVSEKYKFIALLEVCSSSSFHTKERQDMCSTNTAYNHALLYRKYNRVSHAAICALAVCFKTLLNAMNQTCSTGDSKTVLLPPAYSLKIEA